MMPGQLELLAPGGLELISLREYSRRRNVSLFAVQEAIESGRISTQEDHQGNLKINPAQADEEWARNTNPAKQPKKGNAGIFFNYQEERAKREHYLAELARLDFEKHSGQVVDLEVLQKQAQELAHRLKESLFQIPKRMSAQLALESNAVTIDAILTQEIHQTLIQFNGDLKRVAQIEE
jgi:hypothetical protein